MPDQTPRVVIIGAGFAGLTAAKALAKAPVEVIVIDRRNHHLFQPLLYQVATAGLSPNQIATPIRTILRHERNANVVLGEAIGIDKERREVLLRDARIAYDFLIVATGARHSYFGHDDWEPAAPGLKTIEDATELRRRILLAFERAEMVADPAERTRLLTFIVVGAGPTGVEMAGAAAELAKYALAMDFRKIDTSETRIVLVEGGKRILPAFDEKLATHAHHALENLGVEIRLGAMVTRCNEDGVTLGDGETIAARTIMWAAGVASSPAAAWVGAKSDGVGRALVGPDLSLAGHPEIFIIGDCAHVTAADGKLVPGLASTAKQEGAYVAQIIARATARHADRPAFVYRNLGELATVGRKSAIADFGWIKLTGFIGWVLWCAAHIYFLIGFRNRVAVALDWLWSYATFERGARLITGPIDATALKPGRTKDAA